MLNRSTFVPSFKKTVSRLGRSEKITKEIIKEMSRQLLTALHFSSEDLKGDIQFVNNFMNALTPMNRKTAKLFFTHFAGFHYSEDEKMFTKKSPKRFDEARTNSEAFLADPNNNMWSWAERNIKIERTYSVDSVTSAIEKAIKNHIPQGEIVKAVFAGGIDKVVLFIVLDELANESAQSVADDAQEEAQTDEDAMMIRRAIEG